MATVGTGAAMLPRSAYPAVAARRVRVMVDSGGTWLLRYSGRKPFPDQRKIEPRNPLGTTSARVLYQVAVAGTVIPSGNFAKKIHPGWPDIQGLKVPL